jgi:hypothetical protein
MSKTRPWYLDQRAEALAVVHLTRRPDLAVAKNSPEKGFDLTVEILRDGRPTQRTFGVQVGARVRAITADPADVLATAIAHRPAAGDWPFPIGLFYFTMQDEAGYFVWVAEPVVTADGRPKLLSPPTAAPARLDAAAVDGIVAAVDRWYDALFRALAV